MPCGARRVAHVVWRTSHHLSVIINRHCWKVKSAHQHTLRRYCGDIAETQMLKLLTGEIQSGKTRWLQREVERHTAAGSVCYGVVTPGIWRSRVDATNGQTSYEKLKIEALLLPEGKRIPFACRRDLQNTAKNPAPSQQSDRAHLGWAIDDAALDVINHHFDALSERAAASAVPAASAAASATVVAAAAAAAAAATVAATFSSATNQSAPGLLVVDELGPLELEHGGGFSSAVRLLLAGPTPLWPDALIVVRPRLIDKARKLFQAAWGDIELLNIQEATNLLKTPSELPSNVQPPRMRGQ
jgi:nucleoside-triphosphatase THEP1